LVGQDVVIIGSGREGWTSIVADELITLNREGTDREYYQGRIVVAINPGSADKAEEIIRSKGLKVGELNGRFLAVVEGVEVGKEFETAWELDRGSADSILRAMPDWTSDNYDGGIDPGDTPTSTRHPWDDR
jgi:hypothetical protein